MDKIKENLREFRPHSAQDTYDEELESWIHARFLEEAAAIEEELADIPDSEEWEPTEEKFQALMTRIKEKELEKESGGIMVRAADADEKHYIKKKNYRKQIKGFAAAAAIVLGIFGLSMSGEASRAYIMETASRLLGNKVAIEMDNDDILESDKMPKYENEEIEEALHIQMPTFFYLPSGMQYQNYVIDDAAYTAIIQYIYDEQVIYFLMCANDNSATALIQHDVGNEIQKISSDLTVGLNISLWEILEQGDDKPTYALKWSYKNSYYELFGKLEKEEICKIAEKIMY